jgi:hypothetical protein
MFFHTFCGYRLFFSLFAWYRKGRALNYVFKKNYNVERIFYLYSLLNMSKRLSLVGWLVGSLFNDAFPVTGLYSVDDRIIIE